MSAPVRITVTLDAGYARILAAEATRLETPLATYAAHVLRQRAEMVEAREQCLRIESAERKGFV